MCQESKLAKILSVTRLKDWPCLIAFVFVRLIFLPLAASPDLEMVTAAFLAEMSGKKELQTHILNLTQPC